MDLLQQNLAILKRKDPLLSERIVLERKSDRFQAIPSRSGHPTLLHTDPAGKMSFLHSSSDPCEEARRQVEGYRFDGADGTILYGFGLGYLAREIARRMDPGHILYVVECLPEIFTLAMSYVDLTEILAHDRVLLFLGDGADQILNRFSPIQHKVFTGRVNKLIAPPLKALCASKYDEIEAAIQQHVLSLQVSFSSFNNLKDLLLSNLFKNVPFLLDSSPVENLRRRLENRPALVVSAGPSLDLAMEAIRNRGRDFAVISVDAAVKPLVQNGIVPHWVVTCDPLPINRNKVQGLPPEVLGSAALVFQSDACPEVIGSFGGERFFCGSPNSLSHRLVNVGRDTYPFPDFQGASHLAFLLARLMGADPILFVGLDLAFPEDRHHAEGCGHTWGVDCSRTDLPLVPANDGRMVKSTPIFMTMNHLIGKDVMKCRSRCINVSRRGAVIRGAEPMEIEEAMKAESRIPCPPVYPVHLTKDGPQTIRDDLGAAAREALGWMISEAEILNGITEQAFGRLRTVAGERAPWRSDELRRLYQDAASHAGFLKAISDFLPRYMVSAARTAFGPAERNGSRADNPDEKTLSVFFEEMHGLMPELLLHSREALQTLTDERYPSGACRCNAKSS